MSGRKPYKQAGLRGAETRRAKLAKCRARIAAMRAEAAKDKEPQHS